MFPFTDLPRNKRWFFLIYLIIFKISGTSGQSAIQFEHYYKDQGLSQSSVTCIIQDSQGFIWAGTQDGLNRFDGYEFLTFKHNPEDSSSLIENNIWTLFEDSEGYIWVGTFGGLSRLDPQTGLFINYKNDPLDENSLSGNIIKSIFEDSKGQLWIGTSRGGLNVLDRAAGHFQHFKYDPDDPSSLGEGWVWSIFEDSKNELWIGTSRSLCKFDRSNSRFTRVNFEPFQDGSAAYRVLFEDKDKQFWIGTSYGLIRYQRDSGAIELFDHDPNDPTSICNNEIRGMQQRDDGQYWIATRKGLSLFDGKEFKSYVHDPDQASSLPDNSIQAILLDRTNDLWAGTLKGLSKQDRFSPLFGHMQVKLWHSSASDLIFSIYQNTAGEFLVGTSTGVFIHPSLSSSTNNASTGLTPPIQKISDTFTWNIMEDKAGRLWVTQEKGGIGCYKKINQSWVPCTEFNKLLKNFDNVSTYSIIEGHDNKMWLGTERGLGYLDLNVGQSGWEKFAERDSTITRERGIISLLIDREGLIWMGGFDGLHTYHPQHEQLSNYLHHPQDSTSISSNTIYCLFEDQAGKVWVGTGGGGLNLLLDKEMGTFRRFREKHGLPSDVINDILEDDHGRLWLSTNKGITRFDHQLPAYKSWDVSDGLQGDEFNFNAAYKDIQTGQLHFGGINGLNRFHPDSIKPNPFLPPVVISGFRVYDSRSNSWKTPYATGIPPGKRLEFSNQENVLEFEVAALSYQKSIENQYAYQLVGLNHDWISLDTDRKITFTHLKSGTYTLKFKAANNDGLWNETGVTLKFTILPPWWWSWWAKTLYTILAIGMLWGAHRWRTMADRKKIRLQEKEIHEERALSDRLLQVDRLKDQFLANTSHELRTPLQGIIGLSESLIERVDQHDQQEDLSMIISSGKRLNSLVNDILDFSKLKNLDIELMSKPINLRVLADVVLLYNMPLVKGKKLELKNEIPTDLPTIKGDEDRLQQVFYNLIGNAIKFTETGTITLAASIHSDNPASAKITNEEMVLVSVSDTGIGIPENKQSLIFQEFEQVDGSISRSFAGTGLGLSISKRLVELHGGSMWVESTEGKGSTFFFTLPSTENKASTLPTIPEEPGKASNGSSSGQAVIPTPVPVKGNDAIRILVVDDEAINQQVFKNHLSGGNYELSHALNGEEALKAIEVNGNFDLVLLDVMMPRMSGYEVCEKIREKYLPSELPIIMITAKNQLQDIVHGLSLGANDYLPKPFHKEELLARIKTQVDLHHIFSVAGRFVPNEFLHSINRERITEVLLGDYTEQEVTVLFTDIRDYTTLAETMTPEQNFKFVNAFHGRMGPIIRKHRGFVNQYLGDAIMAIFPVNPEDALLAAVEMQQGLADYNQERSVEGLLDIRMGVGLHTGSLIMGIIGDRNRMDAATIADTVNTASRIEGLTKYYGSSILLSQDAYERMDGRQKFQCRYFGKVLVKGKSEPVGLYECYDGEAHEVSKLKAETQPEFEIGLQQYFEQKFPEATTTFSKILKINAADKAASLFLNKSNTYSMSGVSEEWTGVEVMTFK